MPRSLDDVTWPLRTERLTIRRAAPSDADPVWAYRRLEPVSRYMTALPGGIEEYRETFAEPERLAATLIAERDGDVVGDLMVRITDAWSQREVAESLHRTGEWMDGLGYAMLDREWRAPATAHHR